MNNSHSNFWNNLPERWLTCPRKSQDLIAGKFLASKVPINSKFDDLVPVSKRYSPAMIFNSMGNYKVQIGLWIDLCNTSRFYNQEEVLQHDCKYVKIQCRGHGETPSSQAVKTFNSICQQFISKNPLDAILVHCTHGFNRTGYMIVSYLVEIEDMDIETALSYFSRSRSPGIYKGFYIRELYNKYGYGDDAPSSPERPDWCFDEAKPEGDFDDSYRLDETRQGAFRREFVKKNPQFMSGIEGVYPLAQNNPLLSHVQRKVQDMVGWKKNGFPGCQPVSMDRNNIHRLKTHRYRVSWKADGTRYMLLIDGKDQIFFIDRDNSVYKVNGMVFLQRKNENNHIRNTLLDGEMVIDEVDGMKKPHYLVYDIIKFEGISVGDVHFDRRLLCIEKEIVHCRMEHYKKGIINRNTEPFGLRNKQFWELHYTEHLLGPKFTKESLGHEPDGLIFQPCSAIKNEIDTYKAGTDNTVMKWKPPSLNSVDFRLNIFKEGGAGKIPKTIGKLYVGGSNEHFSQIKVTNELRQLDNKIIECSWDCETRQWIFMRVRTDKSFPNHIKTANSVVKSILEPVTQNYLLSFIRDNQDSVDQQVMPPPSSSSAFLPSMFM